MNGEPPPYDHGYPVCLPVPAWVGIASISWLGQIEVADHALCSPWNTTQYRLTGPSYPADSPPLTTQVVESAFELPSGASFPAGARQVLTGRSWSGQGSIRGVEVSADGGATWQRARLGNPSVANAWVSWKVAWKPTAPGSYELPARASVSAGRTQPDSVPFNDSGHLFWAVVRHPVVAT